MISPYQTEKYSSDKTTSSELLHVTLSKASNGELKLISCYEPYESVTLGLIDQLFQDANLFRADTDTLLDKYIKDFEE
ncbi:hypothetical protein SAMN04488542_103203 [Fontibacillus panacisegetis]|uniref:Uncharacterized protein n=1 Tax=Fontibacillus panacisegetis TaxID=670482 RepID=A0A1G7GUG5_9BACL|nr:hypothetical protein [Fontibacillus panacisegetis]SDE91751.1 hypothetical protein SAMN04488542_103203 [Fontibacillus panacisegetis]